MGGLPTNFSQGFGGLLAAIAAVLGVAWFFHKRGRTAANKSVEPPVQAAATAQGMDPAVVAAIAVGLGRPDLPAAIDPAVVAAIAARLEAIPPPGVANPAVVAAIAAKLAR